MLDTSIGKNTNQLFIAIMAINHLAIECTGSHDVHDTLACKRDKKINHYDATIKKYPLIIIHNKYSCFIHT